MNVSLHDRWIGRARNDDYVVLHWPPRFSDLKPRDFFWGYVKDLVYVSPLLTSVDNLKNRIAEALTTINRDMLGRILQEMEYHFDVCCVTKGSYIKPLQ